MAEVTRDGNKSILNFSKKRKTMGLKRCSANSEGITLLHLYMFSILLDILTNGWYLSFISCTKLVDQHLQSGKTESYDEEKKTLAKCQVVFNLTYIY